MNAPLRQTTNERSNGAKTRVVDPMSEATEPKVQVATNGPTTRSLDIAAVIKAARDAASLFTAAPIDQVTECRREDGGWRLRIDVVEARARVGTNDLISSYSMQLDDTGEARAFSRIARGYREDRFETGDAS